MDRFRQLVSRRQGGVKRVTSSTSGRVALAAALAAALVLGVAACGSSSSSGGQINLVAYSTPETVYDKDLIPAFQKTSEGDGATFKSSFGPSGDQQRAVIAGQP